jgi:hypothetical protein
MEKEARQTSQNEDGWIIDNMQNRNLEDEEYFDREL